MPLRARMLALSKLPDQQDSVPAQHRSLLDSADPPPVRVLREGGCSNVLLLGDHAGNAIPASLGDLGLSSGDRVRHIAWDLGVLALGTELATVLDATFIWQPFSRLVIDCNRDPRSEAAIPEVSDRTPIAANAALSEAARDLRREAIHRSYHQRIADEIAARQARGSPPVLVALHSFTPVLENQRRPWQVGILHDAGNVSLSLAVLRLLKNEPALMVGDNEPYRMDGTDYTIPRHAYPSGLPYLEVEFRQDLLAHAEEVRLWAARFGEWLRDTT
jgi:predicted N-formylglutamate amidohydrolase